MMVRQVYTLLHDAQGNVASIVVSLGDDSEYWPVEQALNEITELWHYKISDEDAAAIRERFPFPWTPTWNYHCDSPLPSGWICNDCDQHAATVCFRTWPEDKYSTFQYDKMLCKHCALTRKKTYAEEQLAEYSEMLSRVNEKLSTVECVLY